MTDTFKIELTPEAKSVFQFLEKGQYLKLKNAISNIGANYRKERARVFEGRESQDSNLKWKKLNPLTFAYKKRRYGQTKILIGSGTMKTAVSKKGAFGNITEVNDSGGTFGISGRSIPYAIYHKTGLPNRRVKSQKQRLWLGINLGLWKRVGDKIPLPKRDPVSPNQKTVDGWTPIIDKEIRKIGKLNNFEFRESR